MRFLAPLLALALALVAPPVVRVAAADARGDTDTALTAERKANDEVTAAAAAKATLDARYQEELRTIDRLKKQRGSWRRDRALRESLAASLETAKQLEAVTARVQRAGQAQIAARKRVQAAIAAELPATLEPKRVAMLEKERARLAPPAARSKKIVLPDLEIDPLADPEELEQQALAIRQSETALSQQVALLDERARKLDGQLELRRQHDRAESLAERDDGRTRRGSVQRGAEDLADPAADPNVRPGSNGPPPTEPAPTETGRPLSETSASAAELSLLAESSAVLGEIIDAAALDALRKAQASSDPKVRAAAAKLARDGAAAKLEHVRKQRALIEARVRSLRGKR